MGPDPPLVWVLVKLALTVVVIVFSTFGVGVWVEQSIAATATSDLPSPTAFWLVAGAAANIAAFLFMTWASIAKPWPKTPWAQARRRVVKQGRPSDGHQDGRT